MASRQALGTINVDAGEAKRALAGRKSILPSDRRSIGSRASLAPSSMSGGVAGGASRLSVLAGRKSMGPSVGAAGA